MAPAKDISNDKPHTYREETPGAGYSGRLKEFLEAQMQEAYGLVKTSEAETTFRPRTYSNKSNSSAGSLRRQNAFRRSSRPSSPSFSNMSSDAGSPEAESTSSPFATTEPWNAIWERFCKLIDSQRRLEVVLRSLRHLQVASSTSEPLIEADMMQAYQRLRIMLAGISMNNAEHEEVLTQVRDAVCPEIRAILLDTNQAPGTDQR
ncbi:hypothetical protein TruAng_005263 [Truncatella angustata]|nr:hypothetical protein TruAng_005263 [Truncatella angustata]